MPCGQMGRRLWPFQEMGQLESALENWDDSGQLKWLAVWRVTGHTVQAEAWELKS